MVKQVITFLCDHCSNTHPDINSAKICEAGHKQPFQSPRDFYRNRDMPRAINNGAPKTTKAKPAPKKQPAKKAVAKKPAPKKAVAKKPTKVAAGRALKSNARPKKVRKA